MTKMNETISAPEEVVLEELSPIPPPTKEELQSPFSKTFQRRTAILHWAQQTASMVEFLEQDGGVDVESALRAARNLYPNLLAIAAKEAG